MAGGQLLAETEKIRLTALPGYLTEAVNELSAEQLYESFVRLGLRDADDAKHGNAEPEQHMDRDPRPGEGEHQGCQRSHPALVQWAAELVQANSSRKLSDVISLESSKAKYVFLLLLRHHLTECLKDVGLSPELILGRARVYEELLYDDLAVADAYVSFTLSEEDDERGDLMPVAGNGEEWSDASRCLIRTESLEILCRCLERLGCPSDASRWRTLLSSPKDRHDDFTTENRTRIFGRSRREIYAWNQWESDRMSDASLKDLGDKLTKESDGYLDVRKSFLPILHAGNGPEQSAKNAPAADNGAISSAQLRETENAQLGLYATRHIPPGTIILKERSTLTAIRPHGEALCDACAEDLEDLDSSQKYSCPACDLSFCSRECYESAMQAYHRPNVNDEATAAGFPPATTPFCAGTVAHDDLTSIGRAESSGTAEWDLYFLLISRAFQMAETQDVHPLALWETKYLWGEFVRPPPLDSQSPTLPKRTLPFSMRHQVELPLQWFETLMLSRPDCTPYSRKWLETYDWWVLQTLFAKFRGVADAKQSSWSGEAESASVYPLWCLANHSCQPTVTWEGGGLRKLRVLQKRVGTGEGEEDHAWEGIQRGEQIWNHYTDIREKDFEIRRERLVEVLGGVCMCERCVREEKDSKAKE